MEGREPSKMSNDQQDVKKAKLYKYKIFFVIVLLALVLLINKREHTFATRRWIENPPKRVNMVDDMLKKYDLTGKTKNEIEELLGAESPNAYFKQPDNMVYYLGDERGLIRIDSEWLVISFVDEVSVSVEIETD